eukprot:Skav223276  [mRNA]  locus=scaffold3424:235852:240345:+ [translate_table: standard]
MSHDWSPEVLEEARVHVGCFQVGSRYLQGGVIYGHAFHTETNATKQATDTLCGHLTSRLVDQSTGLRFIAGDFNQPDGVLEHPRLWKEKGWVHVQEWAATHLGIPQRPTCKGVTYVDHVYLSPELAEYLVGVAYDDTAFSDHAALGAILAFPEAPPMVPLWRQPHDLPWDRLTLPLPDDVSVEAPTGDPTQQYRAILQSFESQVQAACKREHVPCTPNMLGRGATLEVQWVQEFSQPPHAGRPCDVKPTFHGVNARHAKWLRQLRRLHNLKRISAQEKTPNVETHLQQLWKSIVQASGFPVNFRAWWIEQGFNPLPLTETSAGVSPIAHTSLIEHPTLDPQFFAIQQTVLTFRDQTGYEYDSASLLALAHEPTRTCGPKPGPIQVLLARVHQLSWSWVNNTVFLDHRLRPVDLLLSPIQELKQRMCDAWQSRVLGELQHRKSFGGITFASPYLTTRHLSQLAPADQALLRTALNGTFFTNDVLCHVTSNIGDKCDYCGEPDSQFHRHWECRHFESCRTVPVAHIPALANISPCLANHGWLPEPPSVEELRAHCIHAPDETAEHDDVEIPDHLHLFTDGSCSNPTCVLSRVATWGLVLGDPVQDKFVPVACGQVHGWLQTVLRGELCAAISACKFAVKHSRPMTLWTDSHLVYRRIVKFQQRMCVIKRNQKDADLWSLLQDEVSKLQGKLTVVHVHSHQTCLGSVPEADRWIFKGNHVVDHVAGAVLFSRPKLLQLHRQVIDDLAHLDTVRHHVHTTFLQIGRQVMTTPKPAHREPRSTVTRELVNPPEVTFSPVDVSALPARYQFTGNRIVTQWFEQLLDPQAPCAVVSWFQLNALFEHEQQSEGVRYTKQKKQWGLAHTWRKRPDFVKRTTFLRTYIKAVQDIVGNPIDSVHLRPQSMTVCFWTMNVNIRLPTAKLQLADELLARDQPTYHSVKSLRTYR